MFTHKYIRDMVLKNIKDTNFLGVLICFQCGEIYTNGIENIDCCSFCGSGLDMIERMYNIM